MIRISFLLILISSSIPWSEERYSDPFKNKVSDSIILEPKFQPENDLRPPVEPPLLVGSFNIQTLSRKKFNNPDIMYVVRKVILRYDLILLLEIHTENDSYMQKLLKDLNMALSPGEACYNMTLSERQDSTKEHYGLFYRTNKLKLITSESYDDPTMFYRKPLVVTFETFTLRDMKKFGVIGQHVKPGNAVEEIHHLADVYDYVKHKYEIEDVLLMGDFNADCSYVGEGKWDNIALWYRSEFTWAITSNVDTTTNYKSCALDRFVYAGENMNYGVILSSARVFNFQEEYMLSLYEIRNISDHWPIELKIRSKMSNLAEKHLTANVCFNVQDSQQRTNITNEEDIFDRAEKTFFDASKTPDGIRFSNKTREKDQMLNALRTLKLGLPNVVSHELEEAVKYKVEHGSLRDESSFADIFDFGYTINILCTNEFVQALICRTTTVN